MEKLTNKKKDNTLLEEEKQQLDFYKELSFISDKINNINNEIKHNADQIHEKKKEQACLEYQSLKYAGDEKSAKSKLIDIISLYGGEEFEGKKIMDKYKKDREAFLKNASDMEKKLLTPNPRELADIIHKNNRNIDIVQQILVEE